MRISPSPGQTGIPGRRGTDMSIISGKLFLRSTGTIIDVTLTVNFLVWHGSRPGISTQYSVTQGIAAIEEFGFLRELFQRS